MWALCVPWPSAAFVVERADDGVLACVSLAQAYLSRICATNLLERLNKKVNRRTSEVGIFSDEPSVIQLAGQC